MLRVLLLVVALLGSVACTSTPIDPASDAGLPALPREFRGVWVATVANIDWPSVPGLSPQAQRDELIAILDQCEELNLNAVVLQVRPACDALYPSDLEPWSYYLTGKEGQAPSPMYDPLEFAVEQAHARGIELHCWFNPYRAGHPSMKGDHGDTHLINTRPELVREYGGYLWLDPGMPEVREHSIAVVMDVVTRYDIDGIHFDDYFYPYPVNDDQGNKVDFPDSETYQRYRDNGGRLARDDWRRDSVNVFIRDLYSAIREAKPNVKLGISPFGIYRPGHPSYIQGFDQYEKLYADALLWYQKGWCDYFTPQLYWRIDKPAQSFTGLLGWWHESNTQGRHLWPGLYTSRTNNGSASAFEADEIPLQIQWTRIYDEASPGHVHFSMKALMENRAGLTDTLGAGVYAAQALVPASPWLGASPMAAPAIADWSTTANGRVSVELDPASLEGAAVWVVQGKRGDRWGYEVISANTPAADFTVPGSGAIQQVSVWVVDRVGQGGFVTTVKP